MKKVLYTFLAIVISLFMISEFTQAQTPIDQWGSIARHGWPIIPNSTPGSAGMGGTGSTPSGNWATVRGGFDPVTATQTDAIVLTGQIEFIGGGPTSWSALRFGVFRHDSAGTLIYAGTDTARWSGLENYAYGYMFTPHSGTNDQVSGNGGGGTQWLTNGGSWISTWSGGTMTMGVINQMPFRAEMSEGLYNWALSVQPLGDGTNELRWYIEKDDNSYWFGGTIIDTSGVTDTFNGVVFGINNGNDITETGLTEVELTDVQVGLGDPIVVPEPPFSAFYIEDWGSLNRHGWPILRDSTSLVGDAGMGGTGSTPSGNWATLRGEFLGPVKATEEKALVVTGQIEFIGGGPTSWSALRFGVFRHDSAGTLQYAYTDSARWGTIMYPGTDSSYFVNGHENDAYGYMFTPHSGTNDQVSGNGGGGTQWLTNGGSWISTWSGGTMTMGVINQMPFRAEMSEGLYNWALSVQPLGDGTNELRWYIEKDDSSYWFGGTIIDTSGVTDTFNGVVFGINNGNGVSETGLTEVELTAVHVDLGDPIVVPEPPFSAFYIEDWGSLNRHGWPILRDSTSLVGDAGMGGTGSTPSGNWATLRGEFLGPVKATEEKALVVTGQIEFIGGGPTSWSALRYGVFRHDSAGTLQYAYTDSARWSGRENYAYGYLFTPHSGTNDQVSGNGGGGTQWLTNGGSWISTWSGGTMTMGVTNQEPARAEMSEGVYNWALSVQPLGDGTNELRWYIEKDDSSYWFGGTMIDTSGVTDTFNGVIFGINNGNGISETGLTEVELTAVHVDLGDPIVVPEAPWQAYYLDSWGFIGSRTGGWDFMPGEIIGNAGAGGTGPNTDWVAIRGGLITPVDISSGRIIKVTGKLIFENGGFEGWNGLHYGLFYGENPGNVVDGDTTTARWTGSEAEHSGYLFLPPSGTNALPVWAGAGTAGSWGAVLNDTWLYTSGPDNYILGDNLQTPDGAVAGAGTYNFEITVGHASAGNEITFSLVKDDGSYSFTGSTLDAHNVLATEKFNGICFALNSWSGSTTTAMKLVDVLVDRMDVTGVEENENNNQPVVYDLAQNYPNPFNPSTTIEFALPKTSKIHLVVYDILGRVVTQLASGEYSAGIHKVNFNASRLASGIYFYRLTAGDFVSVKKLMLLK